MESPLECDFVDEEQLVPAISLINAANCRKKLEEKTTLEMANSGREAKEHSVPNVTKVRTCADLTNFYRTFVELDKPLEGNLLNWMRGVELKVELGK